MSDEKKFRLNVISDSAVNTLARCPRKYDYRYNQLKTKAGTGGSFATGLGKLWHDYLDHRLMGSVPEPLLAEVDPKVRAMLAGMRYALEENNADSWLVDHGTVHHTELSFEVPLLHPHTNHRFTHPVTGKEETLQGKIDALWTDHRGDLWVVEHKTTGANSIAPGSSYWAERRLSPQPAIYWYAAIQLGINPVGVIFNVAKKPTIQKRMQESYHEWGERAGESMAGEPARFFQHHKVIFMDNQLRESIHDLWEKWRAKEHYESRGYWPRHTNACRDFFTNCEFMDVCAGHANIGDNTRYEQRKGRGIPAADCVGTLSLDGIASD